MTQPLHRRLALGLATAASLACLPAAASAAEVAIHDVFDFKGTATDIGVQRGRDQIGGIEYRIEGKFDYDGPMDLSKSSITFHNLLDEHLPGGNGEMVLTINNHDLVCAIGATDCLLEDGFALPTLKSAGSSKPIEGKYESPARFRPQVRVQIKNKQGEYQFNVRLDRGMSPQVGPPAGNAAPEVAFPADRQFPKLCGIDPTTKSDRATTDIRTAFTITDGVNTIQVDFVKPWECSQPGRYHLRSR